MKKLNIIYEDKEILVVNKPAKLLTVATEKEKERTLYHEVREYLRKKNQKCFIVHRLDKDTSGIVIFAKKEDLKLLLQRDWNKFTREYIAIVEGKLEKKKDIVRVYLKENSIHHVYVDENGGVAAITEYEVLKENSSTSMLKVNIKTGRKNQIRATFDYLNHPIVGDKKYNSKKNSLGRLGLHASKLVIKHPIRNKQMEFVCDAPKTFYLGYDK